MTTTTGILVVTIITFRFKKKVRINYNFYNYIIELDEPREKAVSSKKLHKNVPKRTNKNNIDDELEIISGNYRDIFFSFFF
jgi:hypothetical protein